MTKGLVPPNMMLELKLIHEEAGKRMWRPLERDDRIWLEYTNEYSIFGWHGMPDKIKNRSSAFAVFAGLLFEHLASCDTWKNLPMAPSLRTLRSDWLDNRWSHLIYSRVFSERGTPSHYQCLLSADGKTLSFGQAAGTTAGVYIEALQVVPVQAQFYKVLGQKVCYYNPVVEPSRRRMLPLDVHFTFGHAPGEPAGNFEQDSGYLKALGISRLPEEGVPLERPVLLFTTNSEPDERSLSVQEALIMSGLTAGQFEELVEMSYLISIALYAFFAQKDCQLWQGKLEFAHSPNGPILAGCLEPDEMIILHRGARISKHIAERHYRDSRWQAAIKEAQAQARKLERPDWQDICLSKLRAEPEFLPAHLKATMDSLYGSLVNRLAGTRLFAEAPALDSLADSICQANTDTH
jgi:phosphoribosylaminoimidazole-succinocarboxamide synthase